MDNDTILRLLTAFGSEDYTIANAAKDEVVRLAPAAVQAVPTLLGYLSHPYPSFRSGAAFILGWIGPASEPAIPHLAALLQDPAEQLSVRKRAGWALWHLGTNSLPALEDSLRKCDAQGRQIAAEELGNFKEQAAPIAPALCDCLQDPDEEVRFSASSSLRDIGNLAVPALEACLQSGNPIMRVFAASTLLEIDMRHERAAFTAAMSLREPSVTVREKAAYALIKEAGSHSQLSVSDYVLLLDDESPHVRNFAVVALWNLGSDACGVAFQALLTLLDDPHYFVAVHAMQALGDLGELAKPAVPKLIEIFNKCSLPRIDVVKSLGSFGPAAIEALPLLKSCFERKREDLAAEDLLDGDDDNDPAAEDEFTNALAEAIMLIEGKVKRLPGSPAYKMTSEQLIPLMEAEDSQKAILAQQTLIRRGKDAVAALAAVLPSASDLLRDSALAALREIGPDAAAALPALVKGLADQAQQVDGRRISHLYLLALKAIGKQSLIGLRALAKDYLHPAQDEICAVVRELEQQ